MRPLREIAFARSGDKGNAANIAVFARTPAAFDWLRANLTADVVEDYFRPLGVGRVVRHEAPNLEALNFILPHVLAGGGSRSLRIDAQGKTLGMALLELQVDAPAGALPQRALSATVHPFPMSPPLLVTRDGPVTTVTLNRPEKRNALNVELLEQLCAAVTAAEGDAAQRVLVIRGAGKVFSSGLDLSEAAQPERVRATAALVGQALRALATSRLITIAAVHGAAVAGGAGLMSACDFAVATRDAKFGYPEVRRGLVPALIMTFLRRQLRERDAREILLLGKLFDASQAHVIGLINRVVADEAALETEVHSLISSLLQGAPNALAETKRLLAELWHSPVPADLERAHAYHLTARNSAEAQEGIAAFNEKRAPNWAPRQ